MARSKVKSRSHHDAAHLHPLTNVSIKYQLPTPYSFRDIARTRFYRSRSLWQGQRSKSRSDHDVAQLQPPNQCPYQVSTSYTLRFPRYSPDKIFKLKVTAARSKVKLRSHHDIAHLHPYPCPYQVSTSYTLQFLRYRPDKLFPPPGHPPASLPAHPDTMGENNTPTDLKGCGVIKFKIDIGNHNTIFIIIVYK